MVKNDERQFESDSEAAILEAYKKNDKAFKSLLENREKFDAFKLALAKYTFEEIRSRNG